MQDLEILIRYKCEVCGGDGAVRDSTDKVIGNCVTCGGNGRHQEWVLAKDVDDLAWERYLKEVIK